MHFVAAQVKSSALRVMPMDSVANILDLMDFVANIEPSLGFFLCYEASEVWYSFINNNRFVVYHVNLLVLALFGGRVYLNVQIPNPC